MLRAVTSSETVPGRRIDGRTPLVLRSDMALLRVESGTVHLFIENTDGADRVLGPRRFVASIGAGQALPLPRGALVGARFLAVGVGVARVRVVGRTDRGNVLPDDLDAVLEQLMSIAGERRDLAQADMTVGPGTLERLGRDRRVAAHRLAWARVGAGSETDGIGGFRPISATRVLAAAAGSTLEVRDTAGVFEEYGWDFIDHWTTTVFEEVVQHLQAVSDTGARRVRSRREQDGALVRDALEELPAIIEGRASRTGSAAAAHSPVLGAIDAVCRAEGIEVELPSLVPEMEKQDDLRQILGRIGLRSRGIELPDRWWRLDGASFIGFRKGDGTPVAVIRRAAGRFDIVDPETGAFERAGARSAATLEADGRSLFRPLPYRVLRARDLIRLILATPARLDLRWATGLALAVALLGLLTPVIAGTIMNEVVPFAETGRLTDLALGLVMIALGSALFQAVRAIALLRIESFADGALQASVWDRLLLLPLTFYRRFQVGELAVKAMAPTQLRRVLSETAMGAALAAVFSLANFAVMLSYHVTLALAALAFVGVSGLVLFGLGYWQLRFERTRLAADAAVSAFILQILFGIQKIRLAGAENRAYARWLRKFAAQRLQSYGAGRAANVTATLNGILPILASLMFFAIVGFGDGAIPVGDFIAFNVAFGQFQGAMLGLVGAVSTSLAAVPLYETMKPILDERPEISPERRDPGGLSGRIELTDVRFRYDPDGPPVLDGVSLGVEPGEFVAFVGPSGSGKSTIFRLLLGFETPESGTVAYDGLDLSRLDLRAVRRQLGVVLQRGTLLPGSLHENIVGASGLPEAEAWEAARMAGFDQDIRDMPMGMHTMLSEGGGTISGGQRQRLMIARAVVRRPRVLLMDEATSALDNRTQAIVSSSLERMNATRIVIAHRLSTVRHADRIYVIDGGRVVQVGSYKQLIDVPGVFRDIAQRQLA